MQINTLILFLELQIYTITFSITSTDTRNFIAVCKAFRADSWKYVVLRPSADHNDPSDIWTCCLHLQLNVAFKQSRKYCTDAWDNLSVFHGQTQFWWCLFVCQLCPSMPFLGLEDRIKTGIGLGQGRSERRIVQGLPAECTRARRPYDVTYNDMHTPYSMNSMLFF